MEIRCPHPSCRNIFAIEEEKELRTLSCPCCGQNMTARSLARYLEIDRQCEKHKERGTLATEMTVASMALPPMVAILEEIRSLWNVGSIFRSSDGAGFGHLFLTGITGCPPRKEIAKTSLGAEDHIGWNYCGSSLDIIPTLKSRGYQIIGLEKTATSRNLNQILAEHKIKKPFCLIVGNEVTGIYAETLDTCDLICDLPMRGFKESLNVAVAFGIATYDIAAYTDSDTMSLDQI